VARFALLPPPGVPPAPYGRSTAGGAAPRPPGEASLPPSGPERANGTPHHLPARKGVRSRIRGFCKQGGGVEAVGNPCCPPEGSRSGRRSLWATVRVVHGRNAGGGAPPPIDPARGLNGAMARFSPDIRPSAAFCVFVAPRMF
jgi:hypothetical protein